MPSTTSWTAVSFCRHRRWETTSCFALLLASSEKCSVRGKNKSRSNCWLKSRKALRRKVSSTIKGKHYFIGLLQTVVLGRPLVVFKVLHVNYLKVPRYNQLTKGLCLKITITVISGLKLGHSKEKFKMPVGRKQRQEEAKSYCSVFEKYFLRLCSTRSATAIICI